MGKTRGVGGPEMRSRPLPTQADISRTIKAAKAAGMEIGRVEVMPDGRIILAAPNATPEPANALDQWLQGQSHAS